MQAAEISGEVAEILSSQFSPLLASALLAAVLFLSRHMFLRYWRSARPESLIALRQMMAISRAVAFALLIFGLAFIWAPELQAFAISIAAFAVALVVSMKELILAALGGTYRFISQAYKVGDWITIGNWRGEVVDFSLTSTTLEQLGPGKMGAAYTGHKIVFPNSRLLVDPVVNERQIGSFVMHSIDAPIKPDTDIAAAEAILRQAAHDAYDTDTPDYASYVRKMSKYLDFSQKQLEPMFQVHFSDPEKGWLRMSLLLPIPQLIEIEYQILRTYMNWRRQTAATPTKETP